MPDQMTTFPTSFTAGDTFDLLVTLPDYPASQGWALKYALRGGGATIDLVSTASEDDHLIQVAADSSAGPPAVVGTDVWTAGNYRAYAYAVHASIGRYSLGYTFITILADPTAMTAGSDVRSHARKVLDAIEAVLEGRAASDQQEVTIDSGGVRKQLKLMSVDELLKLRSIYLDQVRAEEALNTGSRKGGRYLMSL